MQPGTFLGIDVGGTKIAAGLVNLPDGAVLHRATRPTRPERGGNAVLDDVIQLSRELLGQISGQTIDGLGLGLCELVDPAGRIFSSNCIQWEKLPVREALSKIAPSSKPMFERRRGPNRCSERDVRSVTFST